MNTLDQRTIRIPAHPSSVKQRDALLDALRTALPPGWWVLNITIEREAEGDLTITLSRGAEE